MKYCSIVVVHYSLPDDFGGKRAQGADRSQMMKQSLESLFNNTDYPAEIIVMDNGGKPDDTDWLLEKVREGKIQTLVRYSQNLNFAWAWNQGFRLATGDYVCFTCNDLTYDKGWLSTCINLLEKYSDRKLLATPYVSTDKNNDRHNKEILEDAKINSMAGSNCFIIRPEDFKEIGEMPHHRVGGSIWHRRMFRRGYHVIAPLQNLATHIGYHGGTNFKEHIEIERTLLKGEKVNYTYTYTDANVDYYFGQQRPAGVKL